MENSSPDPNRRDSHPTPEDEQEDALGLFPQDGRQGDESEAGHEVAPARSTPHANDVNYFARLQPSEDELADNVASDVRRVPSAQRGHSGTSPDAPEYEDLNAADASRGEGGDRPSSGGSVNNSPHRNSNATAAPAPHRPASSSSPPTHEHTTGAAAAPHPHAVNATGQSNVLARQPTHGTQVNADADVPENAPAGKPTLTSAAAATPEAQTRAADKAEPVAAPPPWSQLPQAPHGTTDVTVTLLPMQALTRVTVSVHNPTLYRPTNADDNASAAPRSTAGGDAAPYWVLMAKDLFEAVARHLNVHPESFHVFHQHKRLRFMGTLFLDCDVTSANAMSPAQTENSRAEPVWVSLTFPATNGTVAAMKASEHQPFPSAHATAAAAAEDAEEEAHAALSGVPPHLACLGREDFVARCIRVRRRKLQIPPRTLVEGRRQGYSYDEVIQQMQTLHDTAVEEGREEADDAATGSNFSTVAVVQDSTSEPGKPFLGGYRDRRRPDHVLLHAATQLYHRDLEYSPFAKSGAAAGTGVADRASRQTQTFGISRSCQTHREACAQTPRVDLLLDTSHDYVVVARPYFTAAALQALQDAMAVVIQKLYRQWKARRVRSELEAAESARQHQAGARQRREEALHAAVEDAAQLRRDDPRTAGDFERVKADIIAWRAEEAARINGDPALTAADARLALLAITKKELQLLQQLDQRRREVGKTREEAAFAHNLDRMAAPKQWGTVHVVTPETERAGELRDLYERLVQTSTAASSTGGGGGATVRSTRGELAASRMASSSCQADTSSPLASSSPGPALHGATSTTTTPTAAADSAAAQDGLTSATSARLDILLRVKWTVREFSGSSALARELAELIDREADLLHRGRKDASLSGLRKRIQTCFAQFIEDPAYNPGVKDFVQTARGRARVRAVETEKALQQSKMQKTRV